MIIKTLFSLFVFLLVTNAHAKTNRCENKRIVSQTPYVTELLEYLGLKECIVGASIYDKQIDADLPRTGRVIDPDKQMISKLKPDFLITSEWTQPETLKEITPPQTRVLRLKSFNSIAQIQNNIYETATALGLEDAKIRALNFQNSFDALAKQVHANHKKVLLLSACSTTPYSYGTNTWLGDMFTKAGFEVADKSPKLKSFTRKELNGYIDAKSLDYLVFFTSHGSSCNNMAVRKKVPKLYFDGELFLSPSPRVLEALEILKNEKESY